MQWFFYKPHNNVIVKATDGFIIIPNGNRSLNFTPIDIIRQMLTHIIITSCYRRSKSGDAYLR